ncbi:MAG: DNA-deoxyinosine glycosylase, partial [Erysipelotrichaceae bacterium]|nr:DNA-deoxyinosine glycosylase [Erysipelotrichaceae bacterium]
MRQIHNIEPIYNEDSKILILGSFPSVKSREAQFFYHHPQNRFWKVLAQIYQHDELTTIEDKKTFLLENHTAVWDVIESCDIKGSSDSSIENVKVNDINRILEVADIQAIYTNGKKSHQMYQKYLLDITHIN